MNDAKTKLPEMNEDFKKVVLKFPFTDEAGNSIGAGYEVLQANHAKLIGAVPVSTNPMKYHTMERPFQVLEEWQASGNGYDLQSSLGAQVAALYGLDNN